MKRLILTGIVLSLCGAGMAQTAKKEPAAAKQDMTVKVQVNSVKLAADPQENANAAPLLIEVKAGYQDITGSAAFLVQNGSQANQVFGQEKRVSAGNDSNTVEFKKSGFIVNVLPTCLENSDRVDLQIQIELSSPANPTDGASSDLKTYQIQTQVRVKKGRKTAIVREPALIEITVTDAE